MTNSTANSTIFSQEEAPLVLEQWLLPRENGAIDVAVLPDLQEQFCDDNQTFFAVRRLKSAQLVFPLVMGWPSEKAPHFMGKAQLSFACIIASDDGPLGDRPVVAPDESPLAGVAKLGELLQHLAHTAHRLGLRVAHYVPDGATLSLYLGEEKHCVASWLLLRGEMEMALSARGLLLDDARVFVTVHDEVTSLPLDGTLLTTLPVESL